MRSGCCTRSHCGGLKSSLTLANIKRYWLEIVDDKHRYGTNLKVSRRAVTERALNLFTLHLA